MKVANENFRQCVLATNRIFDCLDGVVMALDAKVIPHGLAACRKTMEDQVSGFAESHRISLDGVRVIVQLYPRLLPDSADHVGGARTKRVQLVL